MIKQIKECDGNNNNGCFLDSCGHDCGCFVKLEKEPKQGKLYEDLVKYFNNTPKEKVLEDWNKSAELDNVGVTVDEFFENTNKQETPEEETLSKIKAVLSCNNDSQAIRLLEQYGKWKQERMYSEEDLKTAYMVGKHGGVTQTHYEFNEWFEQFKKKQS